MHDYQHYTGRGERGGANGDCMFLKENPTCNKDIWLLSSAWAWRVAATLLSNTSTVGLIVKQNHENAWDIFWRIFTLLSTFIMHISPSAKASRVGFPAKSSVLSSKLVAGLRRFDLMGLLGLYWIVLDLTYFPCFGLGFKYFVVCHL